jgi:hypothetical protein
MTLSLCIALTTPNTVVSEHLKDRKRDLTKRKNWICDEPADNTLGYMLRPFRALTTRFR